MTDTDPTIYVVDDDAGVRESLKALLEVVGYSVKTFESGAQFLRETALAPRSCVLLDLHMPDMHGFDVLRTLTERGATGQTIVISGHTDDHTEEQARALGAHAVLDKPLRAELLVKTVQDALAAA